MKRIRTVLPCYVYTTLSRCCSGGGVVPLNCSHMFTEDVEPNETPHHVIRQTLKPRPSPVGSWEVFPCRYCGHGTNMLPHVFKLPTRFYTTNKLINVCFFGLFCLFYSHTTVVQVTHIKVSIYSGVYFLFLDRYLDTSETSLIKMCLLEHV